MTLTPANSLPSIPSLPPLELPASSFSSMDLPRSDQAAHPPTTRQSSLASVRSNESFATAYTSSASGSMSQTPEISPASLVSPLLSSSAPQSLKKSLSIDSFVRSGRDAHAGLTRLNGSISRVDASGRLAFGLVPSNLHGLESTTDRTRIQEEALSSTAESATDDLDYEREEDIAMNGRGRDSTFRPGQLVLPPRASPLSPVGISGSIRGIANASSSLDPSLRPVSMQSTTRRTTVDSTASASGLRSRSGSLGMTSINGDRRVALNTSLSTTDLTELTILVVGTIGCGKSTVIHKGLKAYRPLETTIHLTHVHIDGVPMHYIRRTGKIPSSGNDPERTLHSLELGIPNVEVAASLCLALLGKIPGFEAVLICYDASDELSFIPVEGLLRVLQPRGLPMIALACKSELPKQVDPQMAAGVLQQYDVGLIEVSSSQDVGKGKMRRTFDWLFKALFRGSDAHTVDSSQSYRRNPASPDYINLDTPWDNPRSSAPTPTLQSTSFSTSQAVFSDISSAYSTSNPQSNVQTKRLRSSSDIAQGHERSLTVDRPFSNDNFAFRESLTRPIEDVDFAKPPLGSLSQPTHANGGERTLDLKMGTKDKDVRPAQWATLDELLDKLIFLAVSGDDTTYIANFLLTYRRFASPRSVLLAMQKRIRQLDSPSADPMFASFAQMRICVLLSTWIQDYPYDFAVKGAGGALSALVKTILGKTYLLHYGVEFHSFLDVVPTLVDKDISWALKVEYTSDENDDYSLSEDEEELPLASRPLSSSDTSVTLDNGTSSAVISRERKASLNLTAKVLTSSNTLGVVDDSPKHVIKELQKVAQELSIMDSDDIAQQITRMEAQLFLDIQPRHWLQFTFAGSKKVAQDPITRYNEISNRIADWVVSLILCHEKPRARARQVEKLVDVAQRLRGLNNYSALRAFVAGINSATYPGDPTLERFKADSPEAYKNFQSWDLLLQQIRSHSAYRMALRNTKGACIPALEVHISDLIRAHEANTDSSPEDPSQIHWGKFNMIGKFVASTKLCQTQCQSSSEYTFPERTHIRDLIMKGLLMDDEMQRSRITPPSDDMLDDYNRSSVASLSRSTLRDTPGSSHSRIGRILRW